MDARRQELANSAALLVLRIGFGVYMLTHGVGKLGMLLRGETAQFPDPLGLGGTMSLLGAVSGEFVGALLVLFGVFTRFAAVPVVFTMGVAAFIVHASDPWTMGGGASKEPALLYFTAFLALAIAGAGRWSFDGLVLPRLRSRAPEWAAVAD